MNEKINRIRHERSVKDFPRLKLEDDEYVEFAFRRTKMCLVAIFGGVVIGLVAILLAMIVVDYGQTMLDEMGKSFVHILLLVLTATVLIAGVVALMIYRGNRLFITNKHVIQMVMMSPMATSVNVIDLQSIEDASFRQSGILQKLFRYGTFRLSTVGDETTYTLAYSDVSPSELKAVSDLITGAKKAKKQAENKD